MRIARALVAATIAAVLVATMFDASPAHAGGDPQADVAGTGKGAAAADGPPRVLVVSLPRLTWERLGEVETPAIDAFVDEAAVASMSTRTVGSRTSPANAYLTIGAGNRTTAGGVGDPGAVLMESETTDTGSAADVYQRRSGVQPAGRLLGLTFPQIVRRNEELLYGSSPGSLGEAMKAAGLDVAVVANADIGFSGAPRREAALAALDANGQARLGEVGQSLLIADPLVAGGVRTDPGVVLSSARRALDDGASMLLVEMSDLERAELGRLESSVAAGDEQYDAALVAADSLFGNLLSEFDPSRDLVMLVAPTAPLEEEELTVFAMRGADIDVGWARSSTTRRDGYVSLTDVGATVLDYLDVEVGEDMSETPVTTVGDSASAQQRRDSMVTANDRALFRDDAVGPLTVAFIVLLVLMLLAVGIALALRPRWSPALRWAALTVMAFPAAAYLGGLLPYDAFDVASYGLALLGIAVLLASVCFATARRSTQGAPVLVAMMTLAVLGVDILTGGHLQIDTIFGYSPIVAGRFAGFGNQAFSVLGVSVLVVACGGWQLWGERGASRQQRMVGILVLFLTVVVLVGSPTLGSDVGGVLASVPAFTVCTLLLSGRRIRWRTAALIAAATVGVLAIFAAVDLSRPAASRTHLGRFAQQMIDGDGAVILERKLNANLSVLTSTVWTIVIPVALLFLVYLTWRPNNVLRRINAANVGFRAFGVSAMTLGVVAWALNDSGVSMPAMMLTVALPYTAVLAIAAQPYSRKSVP